MAVVTAGMGTAITAMAATMDTPIGTAIGTGMVGIGMVDIGAATVAIGMVVGGATA
jgi:hypothetical protein